MKPGSCLPVTTRGGMPPARVSLLWSALLAAIVASPMVRADPAAEEGTARAARQTAAIAAEIAALRQLELRRPVPVKSLTLPAFQQMLERQLDEELQGERAHGFELALQALGWTERPLELRKTLVEMMLGQAAAIYDPEEDVFLLIEGELDSLQIDAIAAHELTHAITDQHFDLHALVIEPARQGMSEDQLQAIRFLVEGDATYVMMLRELSRRLPGMSGSPPPTSPDTTDAVGADAAASGPSGPSPAMAAGLRIALEHATSMPFELLLAMHAGQIAGQGGRFAQAAAALDTMPQVLVRPLLAAYLEGALFVAEVLARDGWASLDSLYADPPRTTEQVLHPERLYPVRDEPRAPFMHSPASLLPGWDLLLDESVGELYVRVLFEANGMATAAGSLAEGWDGDRLVVVRRGEEWLVVWATVWDDVTEAEAFEEGYRRLLSARGAGAVPPTEPTGCWLVDGRPTCLGRRGDQVTIAQAGAAPVARRLLEQSLPRPEKMR